MDSPMFHHDAARPASQRFALPVFETPTACAGAVASYLLRRIAYRAGAYAPGIDDAIFHELHTTVAGAGIADVEGWFGGRVQSLHDLGYRLHARRDTTSTRGLRSWLDAGRGYRGAIVATTYEVLHPLGSLARHAGRAIVHAVGLAIEGSEADGDGELVMIDPWAREGRTCDGIHPALDTARRDHQALAIYWAGWA
jgi:hypothetical protein